MKNLRLRSLQGLSFAIALCTSASALGQAGTSASASVETKPTSRNRMLEEVVVTAQKREQSIQDIPISIQAFSGEQLDAMGIEDQTDLQKITPGLNITTQVSYVITFLRGIGTDAFLSADPSVATYIDGIYFPFASNLAQQFGSVERIEVLKGPQGTLFGRNATGGAISIHTKEPEFDSFYGDVTGRVGSFDKQMLRFYANVPVTDDLAFNISAVRAESDNYYKGTVGTPPRSIPRDESTGVRAKIRWQPGENWDIRLAATRLVFEGGGSNIAYTTEPSALAATAGVEPQTGYRGALDYNVYTETDPNDVVYGSVLYNAPWFDVKLLGSKQKMDTAGSRDFDGSPRALSAFDTPDQFIESESAEIQLLSNGETGPSWLEWILGGYYYAGISGFAALDFYLGGIDVNNGTLLGLSLPLGLGELLGDIAPLPNGPLRMVGLVGTNSVAAFGQATISVTDWLNVTLGLRHQDEERYIEKSTSGLLLTDGSTLPLLDNTNNATDSDGNPYPATDVTRSLSPKVSIEMRPFDSDVMLFVSWQEAIKASTYNSVSIYDSADYVKPEEIVAYEMGMKSTFRQGQVRFNAAAFYYEVDNLQQQFVSFFEGGVVALQNAGASEIYGAEIDGLVQLFPSLIDDLVLTGGISYLHARYEDFSDASGYNEAGVFSNTNDFSGSQIIRSPDFTVAASLSKTWGVPGGTLEAAADYYYTDDFFFEPGNRKLSMQEAYDTIDARISYDYLAWDLRTTLSVYNLTDERYTNGIFVTDFGVQRTIAPPRAYGLQVKWSF